MVTTSEPVVALVVAAGSGVRLGGGMPKALRLVAGRPLVSRAVAALAAGGATHAIVVVPAERTEDFRVALAGAPIPVTLAAGGNDRQDSVASGLAALSADARLSSGRIVLVHDAARALVPPEVVQRVVAAVRAGALAAIPAVPVFDSLRRLGNGGDSAVVDRADFRAVQTPQGFDRDTLIQAHRVVRTSGATVTDDAAAVELLGVAVTLVEGDREAMKVTEPFDLVVAEAIVSRR